MNVKRWFWLAVALQVLLLLGMVGRHAYTLSMGTSVLLKTAPVDPWDPFRGEYVVLNYEISRLAPGEAALNGRPYEWGQTVWVTLKQGDPYWTASAVSDVRPAAAAGEVVVRGTVESIMDWPGAPEPGEVWIRYGFEQFYVPEGEGRELEQRQGEMTVEVKVDSFGRGAVSKVFLNGRQIRFN